VCEFQGVTCTGVHVSFLTVQGLPLSADFSSVATNILSVQNLETLFDAASLKTSCPSLQSVNLSDNYIGQRFNHSSLLVLPYLKVLDLSNNNIQGIMPQIANCTSLQYLDMFSNELSGTVYQPVFS
jgi:Leucine-rich repeat (LRR) protein